MTQDWNPEDARTTRVDEDSCVFCKLDIEGDPHATPVGPTERICQSCLGDLREFKRTRYVDLLVSASLEAQTRDLLLEEWQPIQETLARIHEDGPKLKALPSRVSNTNNDNPGDDS